MNVSVLLSALAQCLCETLSEPAYGHVPPCFCGVVPGTQAIQEMSQGCNADRNGVAWVRLAATYPSVTVGVADTSLGNCSAGIGYDIEIGVVREHAEYFEAEVLDEADMLTVTTWQVDDMNAIRRAVACCSPLDPTDYILGQYQPIGPQGGMVGGAWMLHVGQP